MLRTAPTSIRATRAALAVLLAGVLVVQYAPVEAFVRHAHGEHGGCTEQVCHCGDDCACPACAHHHGPAEVSSSDGPSPQGPALRSCGSEAPGAPGVIAVSKSLFVPSASVKAPAWSLLSAYIPWRRVAAPQRIADELFRPPRRRIG